VKALTQSEITKLLDYLRETDAVMYCAVLLGFRHGMRASEICGLLRSDIDLTAGTVTVRRLKHSLTTCQPIGDDERDAIGVCLSLFPASLILLPNEHGEPMDRHNFYYRFHKACIAIGLPADKAHPHVIKHALGYFLARSNVNMAVIKRALGHRSLNSTSVYTELDDETVGKIVQGVFNGEKL
jgi:integrase